MIRAALTVAAALTASGAAAESLLDALSGNWALMRDSQASTDAENITAAQTSCARGEQTQEAMTLKATADALSMRAVDRQGKAVEYPFDTDVSGGKLPDGRLALNFSVAGEPSHEFIFWKTTIDDVEYDLLEVLGPPNPAGLYLKCP